MCCCSACHQLTRANLRREPTHVLQQQQPATPGRSCQSAAHGLCRRLCRRRRVPRRARCCHAPHFLRRPAVPLDSVVKSSCGRVQQLRRGEREKLGASGLLPHLQLSAFRQRTQMGAAGLRASADEGETGRTSQATVPHAGEMAGGVCEERAGQSTAIACAPSACKSFQSTCRRCETLS